MIKRNGLTLVELLVSITALGIILVVSASIYIGTGRFVSNEQIRISVGDSANRIFSNLDSVLRQGKAVISSTVINSVTYTTDTDTLVFTIPALQNDGTLSSDPIEVDRVVVYLDTSITGNQRLRLLYAPYNGNRPSQDRELTNHVRDVYFRYSADDVTAATTITVTLATTSTVASRAFTQYNILYGTLRNHQ